MCTKLDIYKDMRAEVCKVVVPRRVPFLCFILIDLDRVHNYPREIVVEIRDTLYRMVGLGAAIAMPPEIAHWIYDQDNDDTWIACMAALRLGVMDQLIANEEAKNAPSNG